MPSYLDLTLPNKEVLDNIIPSTLFSPINNSDLNIELNDQHDKTILIEELGIQTTSVQRRAVHNESHFLEIMNQSDANTLQPIVEDVSLQVFKTSEDIERYKKEIS